ncbi:hypothetical protein [Helicobacter pylori]|uniref:hypothetical protein n=1 Tax=Helicobacter pylori TaxID=210 RepID=UPI000EABC1A0|nr:hypothetical protein [Helicobacter pylori]RKV56831.1 hypothetical protein DD773_06390 [Helicobacter pylori]
MQTQKKQLRDNVLKSLIMLYIGTNDELKEYELIGYKTKDNNGSLMVNATLKKIGSSNDLKLIALDLKMLKSLLVDVVIDELWDPLFKWEFNNAK